MQKYFIESFCTRCGKGTAGGEGTESKAFGGFRSPSCSPAGDSVSREGRYVLIAG